MVDDIGWGFITFTGEIPIMGFLANGYLMKATLRISLKSLTVNMVFYGSYGNIGNVLLLFSNGCIFSSSSESIYNGASLFCSSYPKLGPTPTS
jgi:hypothetical protein